MTQSSNVHMRKLRLREVQITEVEVPELTLELMFSTRIAPGEMDIYKITVTLF